MPELTLTKDELSAVLTVLECDSLLELNSEAYLGDEGWDDEFYTHIASATEKLNVLFKEVN